MISKELLEVLLEDTDNTTANLKEAVEINLIKLQLIDIYRDYVDEMIETDWEIKHNNDDYKTELNETK